MGEPNAIAYVVFVDRGKPSLLALPVEVTAKIARFKERHLALGYRFVVPLADVTFSPKTAIMLFVEERRREAIKLRADAAKADELADLAEKLKP